MKTYKVIASRVVRHKEELFVDAESPQAAYKQAQQHLKVEKKEKYWISTIETQDNEELCIEAVCENCEDPLFGEECIGWRGDVVLCVNCYEEEIAQAPPPCDNFVEGWGGQWCGGCGWLAARHGQSDEED